MIDYIGDISKQDAVVLKELAEQSTKILEFGCGASTQVLTAYQKRGIVTSIETAPAWVRKTREHIEHIGLPEVLFVPYDVFFEKGPGGPYDLVFNDGVLELRREFAMLVWDHIEVGGMLCFHDTRTTGVILDVAALFSAKSAEISLMEVNKDHSNITIIHKKSAEHYENWNLIEGKEEWEIGR